MFIGTLSLNSNKLNIKYCTSSALQLDSNQCTFPMTERVLNLVTYIQWEKPQVIEYDKICVTNGRSEKRYICNGMKALSEILSIYSYIKKFLTRQDTNWLVQLLNLTRAMKVLI